MKKILLISALFPLWISFVNSESIEATVAVVDSEGQRFTLESIKAEDGSNLQSPLVVTVGPGDAQLPYEGKQIRGKLGKSDGKYRLETIWPADTEQEQMMQAVNNQLREDTAVRQRRQFRKEGDYGINFSMFNEHGKAVQWNQFKGEWIMMNFIFTRCRMAKMCPAQTARMIDLQKHAKAVGIENLHQLSVTFDPVYDTPGILYDYATSRGAELSTFSFLTGPKPVMLDVLKQYGVIAFDSKNIIDHTVTTLLFDKTGKIVLRRDGTEWSENDFVQHILTAEAASTTTKKVANGSKVDTVPDANTAPTSSSTVKDPDSSMGTLYLLGGILLIIITIGAAIYSKRNPN